MDDGLWFGRYNDGSDIILYVRWFNVCYFVNKRTTSADKQTTNNMPQTYN